MPHLNQHETARKIMKRFSEEEPFTVLLAQMQSGKSGTYLMVALQMLAQGIIEHVFFISGASDILLRQQMKDNVEEAIEVFCVDLDEDSEERIKKANKEHKITIAFSNELKEENLIVGNNSLIIHDECHMAQSKENIPFTKFYRPNGLESTLFGDFSPLRDRNIYILGVSATPFSEIISNHKAVIGDWSAQEKESMENFSISPKNIEPMGPGNGYIGVKDFMDSGSISFDSEPIKAGSIHHIVSKINEKKEKYSCKYLIVRTHKSKKDSDVVRDIASATGCDYKSNFPKNLPEDNIDISEKGPLNSPPLKTTIVHICGRLRMGQVLPKKHVAMVYEQSADPKADTILQGLLGRMCGYISGGAHIDVDIFISPLAKESIQTYSDAWSKDPTQQDYNIGTLSEISDAMNLDRKITIKNKGDIIQCEEGSLYIKTVPIRFNLSQTEDNRNFGSVSHLDIIQLLEENPQIGQNNPDRDEIIKQLDHEIKTISSTKELKPHKNRESTRRDLRDIYQDNFMKNTRSNHTLYHKKKSKISIYHCTSNGFKNIGFLVCFVPYNPDKHEPISKELAQVNPKCNYVPTPSTMEDDDISISANGGQTIAFSREIFSDISILIQELEAAVNRTNPEHTSFIPSCSHSIHSVYDIKEKKYQRITLDPSCYSIEALKSIEQRIGVKFNGKTFGKYHIRFSSISW